LLLQLRKGALPGEFASRRQLRERFPEILQSLSPAHIHFLRPIGHALKIIGKQRMKQRFFSIHKDRFLKPRFVRQEFLSTFFIWDPTAFGIRWQKGRFSIAGLVRQKSNPSKEKATPARRGVNLSFGWCYRFLTGLLVQPSRPNEADASLYGVRIGSSAACPDDPPPV
jgi:hypothetical protein